MSATVMMYDETATGTRTHGFTLDLRTARISARELIRKRVLAEVREFNQSPTEYFHGLVEPMEAERVLNGYSSRQRRQIDWEEQYHRAIAAFTRNGFFIIVDQRQVMSLDEEIELAQDTTISFIKLLPLVGG